MLDYTIYEFATGRVIQNGSTQPQMIRELPLADGQAVIPQALDPEIHYVNQGMPAIRPQIGAFEVEGSGFEFSEPLPAGTIIEVSSDFVDHSTSGDKKKYVLEVEEIATVKINTPWPWQEVEFQTEKGPSSLEGAELIPVDLTIVKSFFLGKVRETGSGLSDLMLGNPDRDTKDRWKLKRSVRDRYLAGVNTAGDDLAMQEAVRYSGLTVEQELGAIGARVEFEDWVVLRADGIRQEAEKRIETATNSSEVFVAVSWAEAESQSAVVDAQKMLASM